MNNDELNEFVNKSVTEMVELSCAKKPEVENGELVLRFNWKKGVTEWTVMNGTNALAAVVSCIIVEKHRASN